MSNTTQNNTENEAINREELQQFISAARAKKKDGKQMLDEGDERDPSILQQPDKEE